MSGDLLFDPLLKKKKKVKKVEEGAELPAPEDDFSLLKKKKKVKKEGEEGEDLSASLGDLLLKKKKKKVVVNVDDFDKELEKAGVLDDELAEPEAAVATYEGIAYPELLLRFFEILRANNPELAGDRSGPKFRIPPPICQREGNKKTLFANIQEICTVLQRLPEHVIQYLFAELGTSGSVDGQKRLIIKGRLQPKHIENVLRRYILEYVTCKTCKSMNTELKRESANRLHFILCKACGSTRSVQSIKSGYSAQIGRRKRV